MRSFQRYRVSDKPTKGESASWFLSVRARPGNPQQGILQIGTQTFPCALGKGGISSNKREGDGATPLAHMRVVRAYFRPRFSLDLMPWRARVSLARIEPGLGWCDASGDRNYNQPVRLPYPASHEKMARDDRLYDTVLVLDWNLRPAKRGRGSAIFLHLARPGFTPTEGCVAVSRMTMRRILPLLRQGSVVRVLR